MIGTNVKGYVSLKDTAKKRSGKARNPAETRGRKAFEPSSEQRKMVTTLAGYGLTHAQVCALIKNTETGRPIDAKTLREHFRDELDIGTAQGDAAVLQSLYRQAVGAPAEHDEKGKLIRDEIKPIHGATIFACKARPGIKWTERVEHTGKDGGPIETFDVTKLSDEELNQLEALRRKATVDRGNTGGAEETRH